MIDTAIFILIMSLIISLAVAIFFIWHSIRLSRMLMYFSENTNDLLDSLTDYTEHVKSVYGLESYYGDQVLHNLLKHSQNIVEQIEMFDDILYLAEEDEEGEDLNEQEGQQSEREITDEREQTKEEAPNPAQQVRFRL